MAKIEKVFRLNVVGNVGEGNTQSMRDFSLKYLERFEDIFSEDVIHSVLVTCKVRKNGQQKVELTIKTSDGLFRKETSGSGFYEVFSYIVPELEKQVFKSKDRKLDKKRKRRVEDKQLMEDSIIEDNILHSLPTKYVSSDPLSLKESEEFIKKNNLDFFLFIEKESDIPSVIYKKEDDGFGLIQMSEDSEHKHIDSTPITEEDAVLNMENIGHNFYFYMDNVLSQPAVVYDGNGRTKKVTF